MNRQIAVFLAATALMSWAPAHADQLDDIIASGKLRCAITLDFPPMGFRDANNAPTGFEVEYCNDLAKVLGVTAEVVDTPFPDRIPAIVTGRADVAIASTADTLERAKTIGFTIPYFVFTYNVVVRADSEIAAYEDIRGKKIGAAGGTTAAILVEQDIKKWNEPSGSFNPYQNQVDAFLALSQGKVDAIVTPNSVAYANVNSPQFPNLKIVAEAPYTPDYASLVTRRQEFGLLQYLNLFINNQSRTGRYEELFGKWFGGKAPSLTVPNVYR